MLLGIASDPIWRRYYSKLVRKRGGSEPEFRLPSTIVGAFIVPVALFGGLLLYFDIQHGSNLDACRVWMDHIPFGEFFSVEDLITLLLLMLTALSLQVHWIGRTT
jgi:hypothetical protein